MNNTYFSSERATKRFFFVVGSTADMFYTDGLAKLNIEQLLHMELKHSGYRRVVFYDKNNKIYTYDDESYSLLNARGDSLKIETARKSLMRKTNGLKNGKLGYLNETDKAAGQMTAETLQGDFAEWQKGSNSGIRIKNVMNRSLHYGQRDDFSISRTVDAYMKDGLIESAIVINISIPFLRDINSKDELNSILHNFSTEYKHLNESNRNIIVFVFFDERALEFFDKEIMKIEDADNKIIIPDPDAKEIKNMLLYSRFHDSLKFDISKTDEIALALRQAMGLSNLDIKETYVRIEKFAARGEQLTKEACYELANTQKPLSAEEQLQELIGMQSVKDALLKYKVTGNKVKTVSGESRIKPRTDKIIDDKMIHFVLTGSSGTGKTTVARLIGQLFYELGYLSSGHVVETDREGLVAGYVGQTAIKTKEKINEAMGGVLFIDEAYSLVKDEENKDDYGKEAIDTLVKAMDQYKGKFILIAAGYKNEMERFLKSNSGLPSRFGNNIIHIEEYNATEMLQILILKAKKMRYVFSEELLNELPNFCENWVNQADENWGNAREAQNLIELMDIAWQNDKTFGSAQNNNELRILEKKHIPSNMYDYFIPLEETRKQLIDSFDNMVGLKGVKEQIRKLSRDIRFGTVKEPGHYLFIGNPGTGKTTVARYMGRLMRDFGLLKRGHVIEYSAKDIISKYIVSSGNFRKIADEAINGVLFIDEAKQLMEEDAGRKIIGELITYSVDHKNDMCIVLAGYEDGMDELIISDPGLRDRFRNRIKFENYSGTELYEILIKLLNEKKYRYDEEFAENAKKILVKYIPKVSKDKSFSNARYLKDIFLDECLDARNIRLEKEYENEIVPEESKVLRGGDFPDKLRRYLSGTDKVDEPKTALERIDDLIGFDSVKETLRSLVKTVENSKKYDMPDLIENLSFHWVLKGNPGTGKTTVAKLVGQVYKELGLLPKGHTVEVESKDLISDHVRGTAPKTQKKIDEAMGGILFIDEAYSLLEETREGEDFGTAAITTILKAMDERNGDFGVIIAGYPNKIEQFIDSNDGLRGRFYQQFLLEDYTADELTSIFVSKCGNNHFSVDQELAEVLPELFEAKKRIQGKGWGNARETENLFKTVKIRWANDPKFKDGTKVRLIKEDHLPNDYTDLIHERKIIANREKEQIQPQNEICDFKIERELLEEKKPDYDYIMAKEQGFRVQRMGTVFIRSFSANSESQGTGVIISRNGYVLTCEHVIHDSEHIHVMVKNNDDEEIPSAWIQAKTEWFDEEMDMAIIKLEDEEYNALWLSDGQRIISGGESVFMLAYPFGGGVNDNLDTMEASIYTGNVLSRQVKNGNPIYLVGIEGKHGCSGAPVFSSEDGSIVGVFCGSLYHRSEEFTEEVNYIRPISYITENLVKEREKD